jgi:hypothetical protein
MVEVGVCLASGHFPTLSASFLPDLRLNDSLLREKPLIRLATLTIRGQISPVKAMIRLEVDVKLAQ